MSDIQNVMEGIQQAQSEPTEQHDSTTEQEPQEPRQDTQDEADEEQSQDEAQEPDEEPQSATAPDTAQASGARQDDGILRIMDPSGISLRAFSESLIGDYALKDLTGDKDLKMSELPDIKARAQKEPQLKNTAKATYNFEYLEKAFKSLKALGQSYISLEIEPDGPLCIHAHKTDGMKGEWRFYLAPYMEE